MPKFSYKAKEGPAKIIDGVIEADNIDSAVRKIIQSGLMPVDVGLAQKQMPSTTPAKTSKPSFHLFRRVSLSDVAVFSRQMSDLVDAAVPILKSLQIVSHQTENVYFRDIITQIYLFVQDGGSLSDALGQYPQVFSRIYVNMVKTGELSGKLELVLIRLADYLEKELETRGKVRSSLAYPSFILVVGALTVFVLVTFVIPRLSMIFDDLEQQMPLATMILLSVSAFFARYWPVMICAVVLVVLYGRRWVSSEKGRLWWDTFKLKLPLVGPFIKVVETGRFARTLGTLVESGVAITIALDAVWTTINNSVLRDEIRKVSDDVANGSSLREALRGCSFFPEMAVNMISVGEQTGHLEKGLYKIADTYERESDQSTKTMLSLLGPAVLLVIVAMVGFVVVAMLLPVFKMNLLIQ